MYFEGRLGAVQQLGFDPVHQPAADAADRAPEQEDDGERDQQSDDRVGQGESQHDAAGAGDDGEGGGRVGARMDPVGRSRRSRSPGRR